MLRKKTVCFANYDSYTVQETKSGTLENAGKLVQKLFRNNYNVTLMGADVL